MKLKATFGPRRDGSFGHVGDQVIEVDGTVEIADKDEAVRLIGTGNFIQVKTSKPEVDSTAGFGAMLIANGEEVIDLMTLDKDALLTLARDEMGLDVNGRNSEQKIREAILDYVNK